MSRARNAAVEFPGGYLRLADCADTGSAQEMEGKKKTTQSFDTLNPWNPFSFASLDAEESQTITNISHTKRKNNSQ